MKIHNYRLFRHFLPLLLLLLLTAPQAIAQVDTPTPTPMDTMALPKNPAKDVLILEEIITPVEQEKGVIEEIIAPIETEEATVEEEEAVEEESPIPCLTHEDVFRLTHMDAAEADDLLTPYGFEMTSLPHGEETIRDTLLDYFVVTYAVTFFYDSLHSVGLKLCEPVKTKLANKVIYQYMEDRGCDILKEMNLHASSHYTTRPQLFSKSYPYNGQIEKMDLELRMERSGAYSLTWKNGSELRLYAERLRSAASDTVSATLNRARQLARNNRWTEALQLLESKRGYYPPRNMDIEHCASEIRESRITAYEFRLNQAKNNLQYDIALLLCDTLQLWVTDQRAEELRTEHRLLQNQLNASNVSFKERCPEVYDAICTQLEQVVNTDIRANLMPDVQRMILLFNFHTNQTNESTGSIELQANANGRRANKALNDRRLALQSAVAEIARSEKIMPILEKNIFVITDEKLNYTIRWESDVTQIDGDDRGDENDLLSQMVDLLEIRYMCDTVVDKRHLNDDGSARTSLRRSLPTKRLYTFQRIRKESNTGVYIDISLVDFKTARGLEWLPSLLIPGKGTYNQRAHNSVASRAVPFFLFGGLGAAGLWWDNKVESEGRAVEPNATPEDDNPLYWKNAGKYVAAVGLSVAGIIYVNDLWQGIRNSVVNGKRSRALRQQLKHGPIELMLQDVPIR